MLLLAELREEYPRAEIAPAKESYQRWVGEIVRQIEGKPASEELPLDVQGTAFQRRVWQELQRIPRGTTRTYTQVAQSLGQPRAVRAVARACATNPVSIVVPVPSGDSRRRQPGRLPLGPQPQRATPSQ